LFKNDADENDLRPAVNGQFICVFKNDLAGVSDRVQMLGNAFKSTNFSFKMLNSQQK
jgi:hypothetical protein